MPYLGILAAGIVTVIGAASLIEMIYHMQLNAALGPKVPFMGAELDTRC
jgi:branched-chain amino acid transport system permease protein